MTCVLSVLAVATPAGGATPSAPGPSTRATQSPDSILQATLARSMGAAGPRSGAYVLDATDRRTLFAWRSAAPRALASNTKVFTTAAALERFGPQGTLSTGVLATARPDASGTVRGDLYLRGGGDPTFGTGAFARRAYGGGTDVETLAAQVQAGGVRRVTGRVVGDESVFDSLRGGPSSRFGISRYVGPLSGLSFNRGLATGFGRGLQRNPPAFAAVRLDEALERRGVAVAGPPGAGATAAGAQPLAAAPSPPMARLAALTNKPSDNFFAEMLLKGLGARFAGSGTTAAGARVAGGFAAGLGARAGLADGSGLSRGNQASPEAVSRLLDAMRGRPSFPAFYGSLAIAGREGTLRNRLRTGPANGRCRGKTGTLSGVSTLSGYCTSRSGDTLVFSFLMSGANTAGARRLQDRMAQALAAYGG